MSTDYEENGTDKLSKRGLAHLPFILLFAAFYGLTTFYFLKISSQDLQYDELSIFMQAHSLLSNKAFLENINIDGLAIPGQPLGILLTLAMAMSMGLFKIGETAARIPSLIAGMLCVISVYIIIFRITNRKGLAFLTSLILILNQLFVTWHFSCTVQLATLLLNIATVLFSFMGIENHIKDFDKCSECFEEVKGKFCLRHFSLRERVSPLFLFLALIVFILNVNQHSSLGVLPLGFAAYGVVMLIANCCALLCKRLSKGPGILRESILADRFYFKYLMLSFIIPLTGLIIFAAVNLKRFHATSGIPQLDWLSDQLGTSYPLSFSVQKLQNISMLFPYHHLGIVLPLLFIGAFGFWRFSEKRKFFGIFLLINYLSLLFVCICLWKTSSQRYTIFLLALHAPLMAAGIYTLATWIGRLARSNKIAFVAVIIIMCGLYLPGPISKSYIENAFKQPWNELEFRQAWDFLMTSIKQGDTIGLRHISAHEYYGKMMAQKNGVSETDYSILEIKPGSQNISFLELIKIIEENPGGWLIGGEEVWKSDNTPEGVVAFCNNVLTTHKATENNSVRLYSWHSPQTDSIVNTYGKNAILKKYGLPENGKLIFALAVIDAEVGIFQRDFEKSVLENTMLEFYPFSVFRSEDFSIKVIKPTFTGNITNEIITDLITEHYEHADLNMLTIAPLNANGASGTLICQFREETPQETAVETP